MKNEMNLVRFQLLLFAIKLLLELSVEPGPFLTEAA
jgi:hypothetical protein